MFRTTRVQKFTKTTTLINKFYSHVLSQRQKNEERKLEAENESEEDNVAENESSHTNQTSLLGFVLMALIAWIV